MIYFLKNFGKAGTVKEILPKGGVEAGFADGGDDGAVVGGAGNGGFA